jgi:phage shock protein C
MEGEGGNGPDIRRTLLKGESNVIEIKHDIKRARSDRWFLGVCGGIAQRYGWRPNTVRLVAVLLALAIPGPSLLASLLVYLALAALLPESDGF